MSTNSPIALANSNTTALSDMLSESHYHRIYNPTPNRDYLHPVDRIVNPTGDCLWMEHP